MYTTLKTEALALRIEAAPGRVIVNGAVFLPHEAALIAATIEQAAENAETLAARVAAAPVQFVELAAGGAL